MRKYLYQFSWDCVHEDYVLRIFHEEDLTLADEGWTEEISNNTVIERISEFDPDDFEIEEIEGEL